MFEKCGCGLLLPLVVRMTDIRQFNHAEEIIEALGKPVNVLKSILINFYYT